MITSGYSSTSRKQQELLQGIERIVYLIGQRQETATLQTTVQVYDEQGDLLAGESQVISAPAGLDMLNEAQAWQARLEKLRQSIFTLLVMGEFKHGKSTLLNAMLGIKMLAARNLPTTAIISVLVYGEKQQVAIYEDGSTEPRLVNWQTFLDEFHLTEQDIATLNSEGYVDRFASIRYAQIECQHEFCKQGVRLIDSPGLKENVSRTRIALQFYKESDAIIYMLLATQILDEDEKTLIDTMLGAGRLENVFFVVNKCDMVDEDEHDDLKKWVEASLRHHFLDSDGAFDRDFYNRRVFFVSAKQALQARIERPQTEESQRKVTKSGVKALETELEEFLTGEGKLNAILQSTVSALVVTVGAAHGEIVLAKKAYNRSLDTLEADQRMLQSKFGEASAKQKEIEKTILRFGNIISKELVHNLTNFVNEMETTWDKDAEQHMSLEDANLWSTITSIASKQSKEKLQKLLETQIKKYLEAKFGEWQQEAEMVIRNEVKQMEEEVNAELREAADILVQIKQIFAGEEVTSAFDPQTRKGGVSKGIQAAAGVWMLSPVMVYGGLMGQGEWKNFVLRLVGDLVLWIVLSLILPGGWIVWIVYALAQLVWVGAERHSFEKRLLKEIKKKLFPQLREELKKSEYKLLAQIEKKFADLAREQTSPLQRLIEQTREEQESIIARKKDLNFSVSHECARLDAIDSELFTVLKPLYLSAFGREISQEGLEQEAAFRSEYMAKLQTEG